MERRTRYLTPSEASAVLGISPSGVRWLSDTRRLRTTRTQTGRRLLLASDVERLRREREQGVNRARQG